MNLNTLNNPFTSVVENTKLDQVQKFDKILKIYNREKKKASQLYGSYSMAKLKWLFSKYLQAHNIICQMQK